jgi:hypothetical protein
VTKVDAAVAHAYALFREHVEKYCEEILVEPLAWRTRCDELHKDLQWLLFCQAHPLPPDSQAPRLPPPPPPRLRR